MAFAAVVVLTGRPLYLEELVIHVTVSWQGAVLSCVNSFRYLLTSGWPWHARCSKGGCQRLSLSGSCGHLDTTAWSWLFLQVKQRVLMWTFFCLTVGMMNGVVFFQENPVRVRTKMLMSLTGESMPWSELRSMSSAVHLGVPSIWRVMVLSTFSF